MLIKTNSKDLSEAFPYDPVFIAYRGSKAHGMFVPNNDPNSIDDIDLMGVVVGPPESYFGLTRFEGKDTFIDEYDVVTYEIRKFIRLLCKSNPNVLTMLWLNDENYLYKQDGNIFKSLIEHRDLFSSKEVYKSFTGYANGQLHRMEHQAFKGYMGEKRKALVARFGYDCKNAAHAIRLLKMGKEFLFLKRFIVDRREAGDVQELLDIKNGDYKLEEIKDYADELFKDAKQGLEVTDLPDRIDKDKVNKIFTELIWDYWKYNWNHI